MRRVERVVAIAGGIALALAAVATALVNYDEGQRMIRGVQLLQDNSDPNAFYYVPQFPRLATKSDGTLELLCLKYVDAQGRRERRAVPRPGRVQRCRRRRSPSSRPSSRSRCPTPASWARCRSCRRRRTARTAWARSRWSPRCCPTAAKAVSPARSSPRARRRSRPGSKAVVAAMLNPAGRDAAVGLADRSHLGRVGRDARATTRRR